MIECPNCRFMISEQDIRMRSLPQCRYYWGVLVELLSQATGYTPMEMHIILKNDFLLEIMHFKSKKTGEIKEKKVVLSTTEITTSRAERFYSDIRIAASQGYFTGQPIWLPEPNEENYV